MCSYRRFLHIAAKPRPLLPPCSYTQHPCSYISYPTVTPGIMQLHVGHRTTLYFKARVVGRRRWVVSSRRWCWVKLGDFLVGNFDWFFWALFLTIDTEDLHVYTGLVAVDDSFWALFGPVIGRSFRLVWTMISLNSYFQTPTYEILPVVCPNRTVA
jgi:hypothetical protein